MALVGALRTFGAPAPLTLGVRPLMTCMLPAPINRGTSEVESFESYLLRWPNEYRHVHQAIVETWVYRHWRDFQAWLPLHPLSWHYEAASMTNEEILTISHVGDWPQTLCYWGNDLLDGTQRRKTWLGHYMLNNGTTPAPIIVAKHAGQVFHPRERGERMVEPYQIIEGHMRLAYLQAMIRRSHSTLTASHTVLVATIPNSATAD